MKKIIIFCILIFIILLYSFIQPENVINEAEEDKPSWHFIQRISGTVYNGTRFIIKDLKPIFLEENDLMFFLTMEISIENYSDNITIRIVNPDDNITIPPEKHGDETGRYKIENIRLKPEGDIKEYPFDEYNGNLTFIGGNFSKKLIGLNKIHENYSSNRWYVEINGYDNQLIFKFNRIQEVETFRLLNFIGQWCIRISAITLIFLIVLWSCQQFEIKRPLILSIIEFFEEGLYYAGIIVGLPFYFGFYANYIFYVPLLDSLGMAHLIKILIISIVLSCSVFAFRSKLKKLKKHQNKNP